MVIPQYVLYKNCISYPKIDFLWGKYYLDTYKKGIFYATPKEAEAFETFYPEITFWLLPNDNVCAGLKKYLAIVNSSLQ